MKELLNEKNIKSYEQIEHVRLTAYKFINAYKTSKRTFVSSSNPRAFVYFKGVTRLELKDDKMFLVGLGLRNYPDAELVKVPGREEEGKIEVSSIEQIVNLLAEYENIFPK